MMRLPLSSIGLACAASLLGAAALYAQIPIVPTAFPPPASAGASFTGVGNVLSGAKMHWGSIAYSAASRGSNMYICDAGTGGTCKDIASDATTGIVSSTQTVGSIGACGTGGNQCYVQYAYDDSGANYCSSAACTLVSSGATRPFFVVNASGSVPSVACTGAGAMLRTGGTDIAAPNTTLASANYTSTPGSAATAVGGNGDGTGYHNIGGVSAFAWYGALKDGPGTASINTFYSLIGISASGNGSISRNGSTTTGGPNGTFHSAFALCNMVSGGGPGSFPLDGQILEAAIYGVDGTTSIAALTSAMRANGGGY